MNLVEQRVIDFVAATASKEPTPGGGAIAALTGATGAALAEMVANLTFGKKGYEEVQSEMEELQTKAEAIRNRMLELSQADADVFNIFMNDLPNIELGTVMITSSIAPESEKYLYDKMSKVIDPSHIMVTHAGCVISSHCGRGTIGILYILKGEN